MSRKLCAALLLSPLMIMACSSEVSEPRHLEVADYEGVKREYRPGGGLTGATYIAWVQDQELWVKKFHAASGGLDGEWLHADFTLAYKPLAMTGRGNDTVFVAGRTSEGQATVRQLDVAVLEGVLGYTERELLTRADLGYITDMSLVEELDLLILLDASRGQLWALDLGSGAARVITSASEVPPLRGRRSVQAHVEPGPSVGLSYVLTSHLQGSGAIDLGDAGTLVIKDHDIHRPGVDDFEVHY